MTLLPGDVIEDGKWKLVSVLGRGGMGKVFLAEDLTLRRNVAIKVLDDDVAHDDGFQARFDREARLMARVEHPNIVPIYSVGRHQGHAFIVMKHLQGELLSAVLDAAPGPLPSERILAIARQVASALDHVHAQGLIHRDVKPQNLFVEKNGSVTLLDFGITHDLRSVTQQQDSSGSAAYMAPEQLEGREFDQRADLYAFGVVLFELVTGKLPYSGTSDLTVAYQQVHAPVPRAERVTEGVSAAVGEVLARGLEKKPEGRFETATALVTALEAALGGSPPREPLSRRYLAFAVAVGLLALSAPTAVFVLARPKAYVPPPVPAVEAQVPSTPVNPQRTPSPVEPPAPPQPLRREPLPAGRAELRIVTSQGGMPTWASVYVDGAYQGGAPVTLKLARGVHSIRIERPGFKTTTRSVRLKDSGIQSLRVELTP